MGPAPKHYRCYRVWVTDTQTILITDTVAWYLHGLQLPGPTPSDMFLAVLTDLTKAVNTLTASPREQQPLHPTGQLINTLTDTLH